MAYAPPSWMQMDVPKFGSLAPNNMQIATQLMNMNRPQQPAAGAAPGGAAQPGMGGLLGALSSAMQGSPQGGLAKQLFGGGQPQPGAPAAPGGGPAAPPQMGMLGGLMSKLGGMGGMFGGAGGAPMGGAGGGGGLTPTALTGLW